MQEQYTRIMVALSRDEFFALRDRALKEYRHPREQARFLLRSILLGDETPALVKANGSTKVSEASAAVPA